MQFYDIFNGDADGICALQQLRLEEPRATLLVTGVKRDVRLLDRVDAAAGDELTVLDISLRSNAAGLKRLLAAGARCRYFDHHAAGEVPRHANLKAFIDTAPDTCTSLIVDRYLGGRQRLWAVVAAFGDNLPAAAQRAAAALDLDDRDLDRLRRLGECLNYNAYGDTVYDLHYHPADLYETVRPYRDPRDFIEGEPVLEVLANALADDLDRAAALVPQAAGGATALYVLPDTSWSRRIHGFFANQLARAHPKRAHALLVRGPGGYTVSVRAPIENPRGADTLCSRFETGGGRQAAAGINRLPEADYSRFVEAFGKAFSG
ncbi:MAG: acetyltransferase [Betaproteobacteria bacterium]|nr:acetyltransferase [Betaproteobacteria bacterium]